MICLKRNLQKVWYSNYLGQTAIKDSSGYETGETEASYTEPVAVMVNVSPASGMARTAVFGNDLQYDKVLVTADRHLPVNEQSLLWVDVTPGNGVGYDYAVRRVARSINGCAVAISRVEVDEPYVEPTPTPDPEPDGDEP